MKDATIIINRFGNTFNVKASNDCYSFDCFSFRVNAAIHEIKRKLSAQGYQSITVENNTSMEFQS